MSFLSKRYLTTHIILSMTVKTIIITTIMDIPITTTTIITSTRIHRLTP